MADMTSLRFIEFDHHAGVVLTNAEPANTRACGPRKFVSYFSNFGKHEKHAFRDPPDFAYALLKGGR
jgi:hypothetical protein